MTLQRSTDQVCILTGERNKLKDLLRLRLNEAGWSEQVRLAIIEVVKEQKGKMNVDAVVSEVTPEARKLVPDTVKRELLQKIKTILMQQSGLE